MTFLKVMLSSSNADEETLTLCLGLLSVVVNGTTVRIRKSEEFLVLDLLPFLELLCEHESELGSLPCDVSPHSLTHSLTHLSIQCSVREMAGQLQAIIASRDRQWVLEDEATDHDATATAANGASPASSSKEAIRRILQEIKDPFLPVRAHGLVNLRKLILARDPLALRNLDQALAIFQAQLHDSDTFVYLGAIEGLSALGDIEPARVIPIVTESFADVTREPTCRLKLGEALVKIARRCGHVLPEYAKSFVDAFLIGCRDHDAMIRASSLSNLATVMKTLGVASNRYVSDVLAAITTMLALESDPIVRRGTLYPAELHSLIHSFQSLTFIHSMYLAAVYAVSLLLQGLDADVFAVIPERIKGVYRLLKSLAATESDTMARGHAQQALEWIDGLLRDANHGVRPGGSAPPFVLQ